ncbi:MAG: InlB B-repeat-containing protein, partial [Actinomycetota bacterium]
MRKGTGLAALIVLVASLLGPVIGAEPAMAAGATRKLTITKQSLAAAPGGTGTVTSSATGTTAPINCGSLCSTTYARSTVVTVTATPSADSTFASFSTNCAPVAGSSPAACTLTLANDTTVTVTFAKKQTLTVAKTNGDGNGKGSIAGATTCDATAVTAGTCATTLIAYNTNAVLTATADANSVFKGWTGCTSVSGSQCTVLMSAAKTVTAAFQARYALTVSATPLGTGSGTVTVGGVACTLPCSPTFESGTIVTIAASPGASSVLNGISGACTGATSCAVTVNAAKSASVTFASLEPVVAAVVGTGSVTSTPAGITDCASSCSASFPFGSALTLVASSPESSRFSGWSGACATWGTTPTCVVTVASGMTATANFGALDHLIVEKSSTGGGSGTVTATTGAAGTVVDCGSDCGEWLDPDTVVTLSAVAAPSSRFVGWGGSCASAGSAADCTLTMAGTSTVTAAFIARWTFDLTATSQGTWGGEVTWSDVTCRAATCSRIYDHDTIVTLMATPDADAFVTWGGACASYGSATSCTVTVDQARSVTADFTRILHHLAVTKPGTGLGTVTSTIGEANGPIDCGSTCDADVGTKTIVVLTATSTAGSRFGSWTGPCQETDKTGATCTVDLSTDVDVSADFILLPVLTVDPTFIAGATGTVTSSPGSISCPGTCDAFYDAG